MTGDKKRTSHYIVTRMFNDKFNKFIATGNSSKVIGTFVSGGMVEFPDKVYNIFNVPSNQLANFRDNFIQKYGADKELSLKEIKAALTPVLEVYSNVGAYKKINRATRNILDTQFFDQAESFFNQIDELYDTNYFLTQLKKIPVNRTVVSDLEFASQYFGKATGFGTRSSKKDFEELRQKYEEGNKEATKIIEDFSKESYVQSNIEPEKQKTIITNLLISVNGKSDRHTFVLKRFQHPEIITIGHFTTSTSGVRSFNLQPSDYLVELKWSGEELEQKQLNFQVTEYDKNLDIPLKFKIKLKGFEKIINDIKEFIKKIGV